MWWHGDIKTVRKCFGDAGLPVPKKPRDLLAGLQLTDVNVFTRLWEYARPVAVLTFYAVFEPEHGLCLVTDGERVFGSGYWGEPEIGKATGNRSE